MVMSSRPNSIGMSKTSGSGTPTSNGALLNSMVKSSDLTVPISRSSINFSATKATLIWRLNSTNGSASTTLLDRTAHTTAKPLTKRSETSYSNNESVPQVRLGYTLRRTAATLAGDLGAPPHIVGVILGHSNIGGQLVAGYNHSTYQPEHSQILQHVADRLEVIERGEAVTCAPKAPPK